MLSRTYTSNYASTVFCTLTMVWLQSLLTTRVDGSRVIPAACTAKGVNDFCICRTRGRNPSVRCSGKQTDNVPGNIPNVTKALYILNSGVKEIYQRDFMRLENLETLSLLDNEISSIHPKAFRNLYRLINLNLERNPIVRLDPSGRTFQYLSSLKNLALDNSEITNINKFTFFSFGGGQESLKVSIRENPVQCDCNVKGLKNWKSSISTSAITFRDLRCANANNMIYNDSRIRDNVFGTCSEQSTDLFQTRSICYDCQDEKTNHACKQQTPLDCVGDKMVCREKVIWDTNLKHMYISSGCFSYQSCLASSYNNKDECGVGYKSNVTCVFCCLGPTCDFTTVGGRTVDYTSEIRYDRRLPFKSYMDDPSSSQYQSEANAIREGMTRILAGIDAGFDVHFSRFEPEANSTHRVIVRIEMTALNTISNELIGEEIKEKMNTIGSIPQGFLESQVYRFGSLQIKTALHGDFQSLECLSDTTTGNTGTFHWPKTLIGTDASKICPSSLPTTSRVRFATRKCDLNSQNVPEWSTVLDSDCIMSFDELLRETVTDDTALAISHQLLARILVERSFTPEKMDKAVSVLGKLVTVEMLAVDGVPENVVSCVSALIDVDVETIRQAQLEKSTSQRLLNIIDGVAAKSPLIGNRLVIEAPNIAVAAQGIQRQERRKMVMKTRDASEENVQIDISFRSQWEPTEVTGLSIPLGAVRDSVPASQQQNLERATFVAYREDTIFYVPPKDNQVQIQQVDGNRYLFQTEVNGQIMAASIPNVTVEDLNENITMSFLHEETNSSNPQCVYWDQSLARGQGDWTGEGCGLVKTSNTVTTCGCNHLTNFALLMDVYQEGGGLSALHKKVLSIISYIGCGISLLALLMTLITYGVFSKLRRDNPSKILINLCIALSLSNLVFLTGMQEYVFDNSITCKIVALLLHYLLLASLTWMAVEAFYMYLALVVVFQTYFNYFLLKCSLAGWGIPLVIIIITLALNTTDNYGFINSGLCWLKNPAFYVSFVTPICIILLVNCVVFGLVIRQLVKISRSTITQTDKTSTIQRLRGGIGVVILLGLTWIFAIFAIDLASVAFYYLFAIFNSLQGFFIFLFYCVMKRDALALWKRYLPCFEDFDDSRRTFSYSRDTSKDPNKGTACASLTGSQNLRPKSPVDANRLSTDSTVASNSGNPIYETTIP